MVDTILFNGEQMNISFIGLDQRNGRQCPPLSVTPMICVVPHTNVRPRGANIVDVSQSGDEVTITANGNGVGNVTIAAYLEKDGPLGTPLVITEDGQWEMKTIGSKSVINTIGIAFSEEVIVLQPQTVIDLTTDITDPEKDCEEDDGNGGNGGGGNGGGGDGFTCTGESCCACIESVRLAAPQASITISGSSEDCLNATIALTPTSTGFNTIGWLFPSTYPGCEEFQSIGLSISCTNNNDVVFDFVSAGIVNQAITNGSCDGSSISINQTFGDVSINLTAPPGGSGGGDITCNCVENLRVQSPSGTITVSGASESCLNGTFNITATSTGFNTIAWLFPDPSEMPSGCEDFGLIGLSVSCTNDEAVFDFASAGITSGSITNGSCDGSSISINQTFDGVSITLNASA